MELPDWCAFHFPSEPRRPVSHNPSPKSQRHRSRWRRSGPSSPGAHASHRDLDQQASGPPATPQRDRQEAWDIFGYLVPTYLWVYTHKVYVSVTSLSLTVITIVTRLTWQQALTHLCKEAHPGWLSDVRVSKDYATPGLHPYYEACHYNIYFYCHAFGPDPHFRDVRT